jgi:peptidoglycan/xylan/chitin deacetylase (PgdA/CDA1 family)
MKKHIFLTINSHRAVANCVIALVLAALSVFTFLSVSYVKTSTIVSGVYYSGDEKSNKVTLMINVYWGTEYLDEILDILAKNSVKTTFFVGGIWAAANTEMLKKIYQGGHEIANHGYYHKDHAKLSAEKNLEEISATHDLVKSLLKVEMNLFAPPSGSYSKKTVEMAASLGYKTIMWTDGRDTIDWRDKDSEAIYNRAIKNCKGGDFVLMHPTEATKNALDGIIKKIRSLGFELCTVSENLGQN